MYNEEFDVKFVSDRKAGCPMGLGEPHIPNKEESKELRRLMQKSGETEAQVRSKIENRRLLAKAAKSPSQPSKGGRYRIMFIREQRRFAAIMKLPVYDPLVRKAVCAALRESYCYWYQRSQYEL